MFGQLGSADFGRDPKVFQTPSAWWVPATRCYADFGKRDTRDMQSAGLREALLLAPVPIAPSVLIWILPPRLATIFRKGSPSILLRLENLSAAIVLLLSYLALALLILLSRPYVF